MKIQVLGTGCPKCKYLFQAAGEISGIAIAQPGVSLRNRARRIELLLCPSRRAVEVVIRPPEQSVF